VRRDTTADTALEQTPTPSVEGPLTTETTTTPPPAAAEQLHVVGTVVRASGADTTAIEGRWVVLHGIAASGGAAIDSVHSDVLGGFTLSSPTLQHLTSYLVSVDHQGITYYSDPLVPGPDSAHVLPPLVVYDTSSVGPPIQLARRHLMVGRRADDGWCTVVELLVLDNQGTRIRVPMGRSQPVWSGRIPAEARDFKVVRSDVRAEAIRQVGSSVAIAAPIPPGRREVLVGYLLPPYVTRLNVPVDQSVGEFAVLLEDSTASVDGAAFTFAGTREIEDGVLREFVAGRIEAGTTVTVHLPLSPI